MKVQGTLAGFKVAPSKDGGLEGQVTVRFATAGEEARELTELMRGLINLEITHAQMAMFEPIVDRDTGEVSLAMPWLNGGEGLR